MERITYRKTLDVHKNGVQFLLQGFQTADNMSRVVEVSLMASGDAIDFPLERIVAVMYVTTPGASEPSINECTIKDNKVVYEVLPIVEEGITTMQLKLIETSPEGAKSVLASPEFAVEVTKSNINDEGEVQKTTFTAIEDFIAKADAAYGSRLKGIELTSDCIFRATYYDGTLYETDVLQKLFLNGNVLLSESFAHGGTGVRSGEDTDNSKYYSNVSKSEALNAKDIMENSQEILDEVRLHGVYTAFHVDFETGEVEYVSPSFDFDINPETGHMDAIGQAYTFNDEIGRVVNEWLATNGVVLSELQDIADTHTGEISATKELTTFHTQAIENINKDVADLYTKNEEIETNIQGDVIWENSNPTVAFEAQTIDVDLSKYNRFTILFEAYTNADMFVEYHFTEKDISHIASASYSHRITIRKFVAKNDGIVFSSGQWGQDAQTNVLNSDMIPLKIKGYKY